MARKERLKFKLIKLDEGRKYTIEEQCIMLTGKSPKEIALEIFENPGGKWDHVLEPLTEEQEKAYKEAVKKRRARERRAAGGW